MSVVVAPLRFPPEYQVEAVAMADLESRRTCTLWTAGGTPVEMSTDTATIIAESSLHLAADLIGAEITNLRCSVDAEEWLTHDTITDALTSADRILAEAQEWREPRADVPPDVAEYVRGLKEELAAFRGVVSRWERGFERRLAAGARLLTKPLVLPDRSSTPTPLPTPPDSPPTDPYARLRDALTPPAPQPAAEPGDRPQRPSSATPTPTGGPAARSPRKADGEVRPDGRTSIVDVGSENDLLSAIDATIKHFLEGDIVEGRVVKVDRDEVLLDIGYKTEGVIPSRELSIKHDVDPNEVVAVGDEVEALVLQKEDKEGRLILSKKRAQYERAWDVIEEIKEEDGVVTGTVIEVVKGGLILDIGLRAFLPSGQVEMRRVRDLKPYVGREIEAKIIELDKNRDNVVLSRRAWLEQTQSEVRTTFLKELGKGQVRQGVVSSIVDFGAFVDLGGVDGLVRVSELSWKHIDHPSEVVEVGDEVTVEVLDVDMDRERVSLSLRATQEDPWQHFARTHAIGQVVPGKVTKLVPFGAFVRVDDGIEGLVHISELAERHVELPEQVVQVGQEIFVKVIDIDLERRRLSLSLKKV